MFNQRSFVIKLFLSLIILFNQVDIIAQGITSVKQPPVLPSVIQPLKVGDKVPEIFFNNVLNYKSKSAKLSDFSGKVILLDMWSTLCTSCIAAFPKMEELQEEFSDQVQILLVNSEGGKYDSYTRILSILNKNKDRTGYYPRLPIPSLDTILNLYFPHNSVPHYVWINKEGILLGATRSEYVSSDVIKQILITGKLDAPQKNEIGFDQNIPLLIKGNGGNENNFIYRSVLTPYNGTLETIQGMRINEDGMVIGYYMINYPLRYLVYTAYLELFTDLSRSQVIFDVRRPEIFSTTTTDSTSSFSYDISFPPIERMKFGFSKFLQEDLKRTFNVNVKKVKLPQKAYVIYPSQSLVKMISKHSEKSMEVNEESLNKYIHNVTLSEFLVILKPYFDRPVLNETQLNETIDIDFPSGFSLKDSKELLSFLRHCGFKIEEEEKHLDAIIVSDN